MDNFAFTLSTSAETITATTDLANANVKYGDADCSTDYLLIAGEF